MDSIRGGAAELRGDEARHLTRVLRVEPGQRFEISDNQQAYLAEITEARGERVMFQVIEALPAVLVSGLDYSLRQPYQVRPLRVDHRKGHGTGRGPHSARGSHRGEKGLFDASRKRSERWARIARESSQQARRVRLPEILPAVRFERCLQEVTAHRYSSTKPLPRRSSAKFRPSAPIPRLC